MAAIDDGFADASASQISLMNKFTVVYEDLAIKNTPDFEINIPSVWKVAKKWAATGSHQAEQSNFGQLNRNDVFESKYISDISEDQNWTKRIAEKFFTKHVKKIAAKHLGNFEKSLAQYEKFFEEWKAKEENRFAELDIYLSDKVKSLEPNQVDRLMETSNSFKDIAEELAPKFRQTVEHLKELSRQISDYGSIKPNLYEDIVAKTELSFSEQIEELLDFSDYYRGLLSFHDPSNKVVKVFDDVDSLVEYIEAI